MGSVVSKPSISWLDFSPEDLRRARDLIKGMQVEGVVDELGFGTLQSAIADRLYPATTTVMTTSRYLYFVPAIYVLLERRRTRSADVDEQARELQDQLREVLARNESQGVIGKSAKREIKRAPSNIYWSGLRQLGIFTRQVSEAGYQAQFDRLREEARAAEDDDGSVHASGISGTSWDPSLPTVEFLDASGGFASDTDFHLARAEARDLGRRFRELKSDVMPSLLTHLVEAAVLDLPYPWLAPRPPEVVRILLGHAEALSVLARGATLQYHQLLMEARADASMPVPRELDVGEAFRRWREVGRRVLRRWDLSEFFRLPPVKDALRHGDRSFIEGWQRECLAATDHRVFLMDGTARELIRARELDKRPYKARLRHPKHLAQWKPPQRYPDDDGIAYELWYRHDVGQQFVRDIVTGLRSGAA